MCPSEPASDQPEEPGLPDPEDVVVDDLLALAEDGIPVPRKAGRPDARTRRDLLTTSVGCFLLMLSLALFAYVGLKGLARIFEK